MDLKTTECLLRQIIASFDTLATLVGAGGGSGGAGVEWLDGVTGRTGGGATKLDGQDTTSLTPSDKIYYFKDATLGWLMYHLEADTAAESDPNVIRPDDYNASTNAKVWVAVNI